MSAHHSLRENATHSVAPTPRTRLIREKLACLRSHLSENALDACLIPTSDPHQSEYLANHWKFREWLSGFTGSAGTLVVTANAAGLWTDSRYFLQAEAELDGTGITLFKMGIPGTPSPEAWIVHSGCRRAALDGNLFSTDEALRLKGLLGLSLVELLTDFNPYKKVWPERPDLPHSQAWALPVSLSGESTISKLERVRQAVREAGADALPLSMLDEIAWLFNVRGSDIEYNPVVLAYAYVDSDRCILFTEPSKIGPDVALELQQASVELAPYDDFLPFMTLLKGVSILFDASKLSSLLYERVKDGCSLILGSSPVRALKARKNAVEMEGFRLAMQKDGAAWVRLLMWLEQSKAVQTEASLPPVTEYEVGERIAAFRRLDEAYIGESFSPIAAFRDHGAIVHYEAEPSASYSIDAEGVLLIDVGAQYRHGTTDATRTLYLNGEPPDAFKADYTCLLKGLIDLSLASFPEGTRGTQLDILARQYLWSRQLNYLHGTGHGIGHCLCVHEGPQSIRMNENAVCMEPGMVVSNEPGLYRAGEYGIRLENVIHVVEKTSTEWGRFLAFETLTLIPFSLDCVDMGQLEQRHVVWLNAYHQTVYERLSPLLNAEECNWLRGKTRSIS